MIGSNSRLEVFGQVATDSELRHMVKNAVTAGFAVVLCKPGTKHPVCTLAPTYRAKKHDCGSKHAITDPKLVERSIRYAQAQHPGQQLNLAIMAQQSGLALVDVDTPDQLNAFLVDPRWNGQTRPGLTVSSPGTQRDGQWIHHGGGHVYFDISEVDTTGWPTKYVGPGGWVLMLGGYVLVPPSVRPEGPYSFSDPEIHPMPAWLSEAVQGSAKRQEKQSKPRDPDNDIDAWAGRTPWSELLRVADGWEDIGRDDNCGCPIWWVQGRSEQKSATAHEPDCELVGLLHLWTTEPPDFLRGKGENFTKLWYLAHRDHGGDVKAAMRAVGIEPYGGADDVPDDDELEDEPLVEPSSLLLPVEEFHNTRASLRAIREYAHSRGTSADTVLYDMLARISAMVLPQCRIMTGIGSALGASLNLFVAAIGPAGSGKSSSASVAKNLLPYGILDFADGLPLGTGEGIAEAFMGVVEQATGEVFTTGKLRGEPKTKTVRTQVRYNAYFFTDEGEALAKMTERLGSTLGPAIRSAWYGQTLGQQNADADRRRYVPEGSYSMGMFIGFQPETVLPLLADAAAGTPQRFVYCHTIDPTMPAGRPIECEAPSIGFRPHAGAMTLPNEIADEVWRQHHALRTGATTVDRLDAHGHLTRLKLAALLALLEGRQAVTSEDWLLAEIMWDTSCRVRDHYLRQAKIAETRARHTRNLQYADREEMAEVSRQRVRDASGKIVRIARLLAKHVHVGTPSKGPARTVGEASRRLESADRALCDEALSHAASEGWIEIDGNDLAPGLSQPA